MLLKFWVASATQAMVSLSCTLLLTSAAILLYHLIDALLNAACDSFSITGNYSLALVAYHVSAEARAAVWSNVLCLVIAGTADALLDFWCFPSPPPHLPSHLPSSLDPTLLIKWHRLVVNPTPFAGTSFYLAMLNRSLSVSTIATTHIHAHRTPLVRTSLSPGSPRYQKCTYLSQAFDFVTYSY